MVFWSSLVLGHAQIAQRSELRENWEKIADADSSTSFLLGLAASARDKDNRQIEILLLEAAALSRTMTLPIPQGISPKMPATAQIKDWKINPQQAVHVTSGSTLGIVDWQGKNISVTATVSGKLRAPAKPEGTKLNPGEPMCHLLVRGELTLVAVALAAAQGNPSQLSAIVAYSAELNHRIAPDLARVLGWAFPERIPQIVSLLQRYPGVPTVEELKESYTEQEEEHTPFTPSTPPPLLPPFQFPESSRSGNMYDS